MIVAPLLKWSRAARLGLIFVPLIILAIMLVQLRAAFDDISSYHDSDCTSKRLRFTTVQTMWARTAAYRQSHSNHERGASDQWAIISEDLDRERIGSARLRSDIGRISAKWEQLAADDTGNALLASQYVIDLRNDFDKSCGVAPTPEPLATQ